MGKGKEKVKERKRILEPDADKLKSLAPEFKKYYNASNLSRVAFDKLYTFIANDTAHSHNKRKSLLLGLLALELELIKETEYEGSSPSVKGGILGFFAPGGSGLYTYIKQILGIKSSPLDEVLYTFDDDRKLFYIHRLFLEIQSNPEKYANADFQHLKIKNSTNLLDTIEKQLLVIRGRLNPEIEKLTRGMPSIDALCQYLDQVLKEYISELENRNIVSAYFTNANRKQLVNLVKFVSVTSSLIYDSVEDRQTAIMAAFLFLLIEIYSSYTLLSPSGIKVFGYQVTGSSLFNAVSNKNYRFDMNNITTDEKVILLNAIFYCLVKVEAAISKRDDTSAHITNKMHELKIENLAALRELVTKSIIYVDQQRSNTWSALAVNGTVNAGLGVSVAGILAKVGVPLVTAAAASNPITLLMAGLLLMTPVGWNVAMRLGNWTYDKTVGTVSEHTTEKLIEMMERAKTQSRFLLYGVPEGMTQIEYDVFKLTLLSLPETVLTSDEKKCIVDHLGAGEISRLQALDPLSLVEEPISSFKVINSKGEDVTAASVAGYQAKRN